MPSSTSPASSPAGTTFIAVGDSFTEGMQDGPASDGHYVGWADRVAWRLAELDPSLRYANLAVRGKLLDEVVADQLIGAVARAPDLLTFHAGGNDVLRPGADLAAVARRYDLAVRRAAPHVPTVVLFTVLERSGATGRTADRLAARIRRFNGHVRATAERHGAVLVDLAAVTAMHDRRLWHEDRLHLSTAGHERVASAVLHALGVPPAPSAAPHVRWWQEPLVDVGLPRRATALRGDLRWVGRHLLPWVGRRLRGTSSGDGLPAKRPQARRV